MHTWTIVIRRRTLYTLTIDTAQRGVTRVMVMLSGRFSSLAGAMQVAGQHAARIKKANKNTTQNRAGYAESGLVTLGQVTAPVALLVPVAAVAQLCSSSSSSGGVHEHADLYHDHHADELERFFVTFRPSQAQGMLLRQHKVKKQRCCNGLRACKHQCCPQDAILHRRAHQTTRLIFVN
jgi:hypothetical protein